MFKRQKLGSIVPCLVACLTVFVSLESVAPAQVRPGRYIDVLGTAAGPLAERVQEAVDVINSGRRAFAKAFVDEHFTPELREAKTMDEHIAWFAWQHYRSQVFDRYSTRHYPDDPPQGYLVIILRNQLTDLWEGMIIEFEQQPPYRLSSLRFVPARPPSQLPPLKKLDGAEMAKQLDGTTKKLADADVFSGAVLLAKDGKPLLKKAYGLADRGSKRPNKSDTKFHIGSMEMMFTGVAIAQLAERGKLSFDDTLHKYLGEDWVRRKIGRRVKIGQLLTHTGGLGDTFLDKMKAPSQGGSVTSPDYKSLVAKEDFAFDPGKRASVSYAGYLLLGAIIEKVTGKSYCEYLRESVFKPAGMTNTSCVATSKPAAGLATPYARKLKDAAMHWTKDLSTPPIDATSTVEDMLKFDIALRGHKLLSKKNTALVLSAKPEKGAEQYGYGFTVRGESGSRVVGQVAKGSGFSSKIDMYLDAGYTAVVLSNHEGGSRVVADKLIELLELAE